MDKCLSDYFYTGSMICHLRSCFQSMLQGLALSCLCMHQHAADMLSNHCLVVQQAAIQTHLVGIQQTVLGTAVLMNA